MLTGCGSLKELKGKYEDKLLERSIEESGVPEMIQNDLNELCDYDSWMDSMMLYMQDRKTPVQNLSKQNQSYMNR